MITWLDIGPFKLEKAVRVAIKLKEISESRLRKKF